MKPLIEFFMPHDQFEAHEWILKHQIFALLMISFFFGLGVLCFAPVRILQGNLVVGISQLLLGLFMLSGFFLLRKNKTFYARYALTFMILFFLYTWLIFFKVPQNHLNILWVIAAPILIFFFLNRKGGMVMFVLVTLFIIYLMLSGYPYTLAEYITLIGAFLITTFVMYIYERVKDGERALMEAYAKRLSNEVEEKTAELTMLNTHLQQRINMEVKKQIEQEQMLLHQYRMARLGEMTDAIAHQWRQPLMHINAHLLDLETQLDRHDSVHPTTVMEKIDVIASITLQMSETIEDFRHLFDTQTEPENVQVYELFKELEMMLHYRLKEIELLIVCEEDVWIYLPKNMLLQVLVAVVVNALEVFVLRKTPSPKLILECREEGNTVVFSVTDNAGGIEAKALSSLFDPYFTTKKHDGGTGLGLYIAKIIVERQLKGNIRAENIGDGASFTIFLPISKQ